MIINFTLGQVRALNSMRATVHFDQHSKDRLNYLLLKLYGNGDLDVYVTNRHVAVHQVLNVVVPNINPKTFKLSIPFSAIDAITRLVGTSAHVDEIVAQLHIEDSETFFRWTQNDLQVVKFEQAPEGHYPDISKVFPSMWSGDYDVASGESIDLAVLQSVNKVRAPQDYRPRAPKGFLWRLGKATYAPTQPNAPWVFTRVDGARVRILVQPTVGWV